MNTAHNIKAFDPSIGAHAVASTSSKTIYVAGQVGNDDTGAIVEGGLAAQTEYAIRNVKLAVEAAGGTAADIVSMRVFAVDWNPSKIGDIMQGIAAANGNAEPVTDIALTLIGVQSLFTPDMLIEIEAIATSE